MTLMLVDNGRGGKWKPCSHLLTGWHQVSRVIEGRQEWQLTSWREVFESSGPQKFETSSRLWFINWIMSYCLIGLSIRTFRKGYLRKNIPIGIYATMYCKQCQLIWIYGFDWNDSKCISNLSYLGLWWNVSKWNTEISLISFSLWLIYVLFSYSSSGIY